MAVDSATHYDEITDAWKEFMGDNFHFGYFRGPETELSEAAEAMIDKMAEWCDITADTRVLDVGCGIGTPAFRLHEKYGCFVEGISNSERGVRLAEEGARERGYDKVRFRVADGMDNGCPDRSFDLVWILEAAHLMLDKRKLFSECHRVLRDGGTLVMCDIMQRKLLSPHRGLFFFLTHLGEYYKLLKAWGPGQLPTMGAYADRLVEAGFREVTVLDVTEKVLPTPMRWRDNALRFLDEKRGAFPEKKVRDFVAGCEILDSFFRNGLFGYGMIKAVKP
ncbi:methyltransferase domain-containing protein [Candidatus Solincola tengchongensis]|uniref:methyltransferase domain-containing protein n=1 Tax=Candidatus Solincola tengchongensis TaxID=2900693 RepID=UPI002579726D|nr:methyltransferase domain-containing protein [Candidatus Solincola tengchongensis]